MALASVLDKRVSFIYSVCVFVYTLTGQRQLWQPVWQPAGRRRKCQLSQTPKLPQTPDHWGRDARLGAAYTHTHTNSTAHTTKK